MTVTSKNVASTAIANLSYDDESNVMTVTFHDGRVYEVPNFPEIEFSRFLAADSIGAYWNANIRGKY